MTSRLTRRQQAAARRLASFQSRWAQATSGIERFSVAAEWLRSELRHLSPGGADAVADQAATHVLAAAEAARRKGTR